MKWQVFEHFATTHKKIKAETEAAKTKKRAGETDWKATGQI